MQMFIFKKLFTELFEDNVPVKIKITWCRALGSASVQRNTLVVQSSRAPGVLRKYQRKTEEENALQALNFPLRLCTDRAAPGTSFLVR